MFASLHLTSLHLLHLAVMSSLHHHALLVVTWLHPVTVALLHSVDVHVHLLLHAHVVLLHLPTTQRSASDSNVVLMRYPAGHLQQWLSLWGTHWNEQLALWSLGDHVLKPVLSLDHAALDDGVGGRA